MPSTTVFMTALRASAILLVLASGLAHGQGAPANIPPPSCNATEHRQFDFWIGSWNVVANRKSVGKNQIDADLAHCALFESWTGSSGFRGRSVNFYDRARKRWHQTWIDYMGGVLHLDGGLVGTSMVMEGDSPTETPSTARHDRITWTPNEDGTVRQHWEQRTGTNAEWNTVFDGVYRRAR